MYPEHCTACVSAAGTVQLCDGYVHLRGCKRGLLQTAADADVEVRHVAYTVSIVSQLLWQCVALLLHVAVVTPQG